ncbi:S-layer homology domain-containing protein [Paenibacillus sp. GCM10012306]|uniref:S-layer homology domain-containing protein n=1 Tax=Paenibacillus sp. GCM10012306 TaxID=3317342 RepID=UPI00360E17E8
MLSSRALALGLALLLVISILGSSLVPAGQAFAEAQQSLTGQGVTETSVTDATYGAAAFAAAAQEPVDVQQAITDAIKYVQNKGYTSDWIAMSYGRLGIKIPDSYITGLEKSVKSTMTASSPPYVTTYARLALAVTAIGRDATNFGGYNLLEPIYNSKDVAAQGINGPIYALLAITAGQYNVPDDAVWSKERIANNLISKQDPSGVFSAFGSNADITGMALQSLYTYNGFPEVESAGQRAVDWLSKNQNKDGGYDSRWGVSSEANSQAILGLTTAGIDPTGPEFTKGQHNLITNLLAYQSTDGGFRHAMSGTSDSIATEQALQALISYQLFLKGDKFYNLKQPASQKPAVQASITIEGPEGRITSGAVEAPTAFKALVEVTKANNIPLDIQNGKLNGINGISQQQYGASDGWKYAFQQDGHWRVSDVDAADYALNAGQQVLFFYGDADTSLNNHVNVLPAIPAPGEGFTVQVYNDAVDWNTTPSKTVSKPAPGVKVAIGDHAVTTDSEGKASFVGLPAGTYDVELTGYRQGAAPSVLPVQSQFSVAAQAHSSIAIEGPEGPLASGTVDATSPLQALRKLAQTSNLSLDVTNSPMGEYVSAIKEIEAGQYGGWDGWFYAVKKDGGWTLPNVGAADYLLQSGEQILFYYGDFGVTSFIDSIQAEPKQPVSGQPFTILVKKIVDDWNTGGSLILPAEGVQVTIKGETVTTNNDGKATFVSGKTAGDYEIEVTGYQKNAAPTVVRTVSPISVAKDNGTSTPTPTPAKSQVTFLVEGDAIRGTIVPSTTVNLNPGDTPYSLLVRQLGGKVVATGSGMSLYVRSIDGLAEFDRGEKSGWMYSVNGVFPNYSAGAYTTLADGDTVAWRYTTNLGVDLGEPSFENDPKGPTTGTPGTGTAVVISPDNALPLNKVGQTTTVSNANEKMTAAQAAELKQTLAANTVSLSQAIPAGAAATLKDNAGEVQLSIPAGAVSSGVTINVKELSSSRSELVSGLYEFTPDGTKFAKPVDLAIRVPVTTDHLDNLTMAWLNKTTNEWIPVPTTVDAKTGIVTGKVSHFTDYAVIDRSLWEPQQDQIKKDIAGAVKYITSAEAISDWQAIGLVRSGNTVPASYLSGLKAQLAEAKGEFRKVTDYERIALAAAALGSDPQSISGYNLIEKIYNNANMTAQGSNGVIFALTALDSGAYNVPVNAQWTRERLVDWLLKQQTKEGGFPLSVGGAADIDITAMTVTALSNYKEQALVKAAIDKALGWLSSQQLENGGYKSYGDENSESVSQVIIALTAVGTGLNDPRFVKAKGGLLSNLATFRQADGGYAHALSDKNSNSIATEQALLALAAYDRFLNEKDKLYSFSATPVTTTPVPSVTFADEGQISAWALKSVHTAFDNKLMQGVSADSLVFAPKANITRAQFAALLLRLTGNQPADASSASVFSDVKPGAWYYGDVIKAKELGIIDGVSKTTFNPNGTITRQDMAVMIARAYKLDASANKPSFKDEVKISMYALGSVQSVSELGYMTGFNGSFDPSAPVTREMAAVVAVRLP